MNSLDTMRFPFPFQQMLRWKLNLINGSSGVLVDVCVRNTEDRRHKKSNNTKAKSGREDRTQQLNGHPRESVEHFS